jgi:uncharacterized sporulation protein YeaH/YhbH (DUF444 family)
MYARRHLETRAIIREIDDLRKQYEAIPDGRAPEARKIKQRIARLESLVRRLTWIPSPPPIVRK